MVIHGRIARFTKVIPWLMVLLSGAFASYLLLWGAWYSTLDRSTGTFSTAQRTSDPSVIAKLFPDPGTSSVLPALAVLAAAALFAVVVISVLVVISVRRWRRMHNESRVLRQQ